MRSSGESHLWFYSLIAALVLRWTNSPVGICRQTKKRLISFFFGAENQCNFEDSSALCEELRRFDGAHKQSGVTESSTWKSEWTRVFTTSAIENKISFPVTLFCHFFSHSFPCSLTRYTRIVNAGIVIVAVAADRGYDLKKSILNRNAMATLHFVEYETEKHHLPTDSDGVAFSSLHFSFHFFFVDHKGASSRSTHAFFTGVECVCRTEPNM